MEENKKKKKGIIITSVIMILLVAVAVSYAWLTFRTNNTNITGLSGCFDVNYVAGQDITGGLDMTASYTGGRSVVFSLSLSSSCISGTADIYLNTNNETNATYFAKTCSVNPQANTTEALCTAASGTWASPLKYVVYNNTSSSVIASGNIESQSDLLLTNVSLTSVAQEYTFYLWLDGNHTTNAHVNLVYSGYIHIAAVQNAIDVQPNDISGANAPATDSTYMVPVYYDSISSNWKIANKDNDTEENAWYNYTDKQWANMVLVGASASSCTPGTDCLDSVTKHDRAFYTDQINVGQPVSMDDILAFYVWIPRYKYKVWNINKIPQNTQAYTYNAYNDGIDIQWESGTDTTGNVSCTYYYTAPVADADSPNETCTVTGDTSNPYYTHPAFTFGDDELTGIWVGKFETSSNTHLTGDDYGGGNVTSLTARIVPNVTSWRNIEVGNMFTVLQNMHNASNEYGLPTTKTSVDSHMMKNTEWGAVAYLTNSIYGKCTGSPGGCTDVQINGKGETSYYTAITGCGPSADGATARYETACTEYNTTTGMLASTTDNITGVYDMSGGAYEYVMGNMSSAIGTYTFYPSNTSSTMPVSWYTSTTSKYVDTYANGSDNSGQIAYNRSRLGDATGEVNITGNSGWYGDSAHFVYSSGSWFSRGGLFNSGTNAGPFYFYSLNGGAYYYYSFRASLVPLGAA